MSERLQTALEALGCDAKKPSHHRHNLISAIALFAGAHGDTELETACDVELKKIRGEQKKPEQNGAYHENIRGADYYNKASEVIEPLPMSTQPSPPFNFDNAPRLDAYASFMALAQQPKSVISKLTLPEQNALFEWSKSQTPSDGGSIDMMQWPGWKDALQRLPIDTSTK